MKVHLLGGPADGERLPAGDSRPYAQHQVICSYHSLGYYALEYGPQPEEPQERRAHWVRHADARFTVERTVERRPRLSRPQLPALRW